MLVLGRGRFLMSEVPVYTPLYPSATPRLHPPHHPGFILDLMPLYPRQREFLIEKLLVRIHFIIVMVRWAGLAPWELEFHFPGSLTSTFLVRPTLPGKLPPRISQLTFPRHTTSRPPSRIHIVRDAGAGKCGVWLSFSNERVCHRSLGSVYVQG